MTESYDHAVAGARAESGGEPCPDDIGDDPARHYVDLVEGPAAVRAARHYIERQVADRGATAAVDDAALVAAELLANAVQHGAAPTWVAVRGDEQCIRIEVRDANPRPPVRPAVSATNMTGRGLALVDAVSTRWGVDGDPAGGKIVWAELDSGDRDDGDGSASSYALDINAWHDYDDASSESRYHVVLGDVPTDLLIDAKAHIDNVVREFSLAASGHSGAVVPEHLARLIEAVVHEFADARDAIKRQALAAAHRGDPRARLTLHLPLSAADAGEKYLAALDEADNYSRAARLLTLEAPPVHRLFRRWYVEAVIQQLRDVAAGRVPEPAVPFEELLIGEVERLATTQRITDRAALLQQVTAALARARTPEDVASVVVSEGVEVLGATGGSLLLPAPDGVHVSVPGVVGYRDELVDALREERIDAPLPAATALRTGEAVWLESQEERDEQFPLLHGFEAATIAMCAVPLIVGTRTLGALRFSFSSRRLFDDDERAFVLALAAQTAQTLQRTELYAAEREASLNLQRALLPEEAPPIPGLDIATYYSPAGDEEAGGDFYDVMRLADGRCVAVVGDVMGRGVQAAAAMAQVRTMIRAYAIVDPSPLVVFGRVDAYFATLDLAQLVTVLYLVADPETGVVEIGNAGHLPPVLVEAAGGRMLDTIVGTPFGVGEGPRETVTITLPHKAALVAVTDGLVERRGEDIDAGIARLLLATADGASRNAGSLLWRVINAASTGVPHDDDVTALVFRRQ